MKDVDHGHLSEEGFLDSPALSIPHDAELHPFIPADRRAVSELAARLAAAEGEARGQVMDFEPRHKGLRPSEAVEPLHEEGYYIHETHRDRPGRDFVSQPFDERPEPLDQIHLLLVGYKVGLPGHDLRGFNELFGSQKLRLDQVVHVGIVRKRGAVAYGCHEAPFLKLLHQLCNHVAAVAVPPQACGTYRNTKQPLLIVCGKHGLFSLDLRFCVDIERFSGIGHRLVAVYQMAGAVAHGVGAGVHQPLHPCLPAGPDHVERSLHVYAVRLAPGLPVAHTEEVHNRSRMKHRAATASRAQHRVVIPDIADERLDAAGTLKTGAAVQGVYVVPAAGERPRKGPAQKTGGAGHHAPGTDGIPRR